MLKSYILYFICDKRKKCTLCTVLYSLLVHRLCMSRKVTCNEKQTWDIIYFNDKLWWLIYVHYFQIKSLCWPRKVNCVGGLARDVISFTRTLEKRTPVSLCTRNLVYYSVLETSDGGIMSVHLSHQQARRCPQQRMTGRQAGRYVWLIKFLFVFLYPSSFLSVFLGFLLLCTVHFDHQLINS